MRFVVVAVGTGAALTFVVASGLMNWVFMTSLGKSEFEQHILGAVSVAVSAFLALLATALAWAFRERRIAYIVLGVPVFLAFAAFSFSSAVGFAAKNRGSIGEDRALAGERLTTLRHEISETETKLKALGTPRPAAVMDELLRGLQQDHRWASSKECADATADASRSFCKDYFDLKAEAALALEARRYDERIAEWKRDAHGLEEQGAGRQADNQAAVLASIYTRKAAQKRLAQSGAAKLLQARELSHPLSHHEKKDDKSVTCGVNGGHARNRTGVRGFAVRRTRGCQRGRSGARAS